MPKFVTIGYGDREGYDRTDAAVRDQAHAHDARLRAAGVVMGVAGSPVQVRNHDGAGVAVENGAFASSGFPVAGFAIIEAATLEEAVQLVSGTPCAVAQGVVEVWPLHVPESGDEPRQ
ncbi:transcription initiation protein [Lentzea tibetensis]|uniref:Transcription initiation protein n=1 Tax=Lentzea tibetensis TaxID=2591470 RepID=A0A563F0W2_9PSEU|nr:YciI family protein [Lentzea tibetensis]TWP53617.1 transcription initiation protein [Lentzea tibetensis]